VNLLLRLDGGKGSIVFAFSRHATPFHSSSFLLERNKMEIYTIVKSELKCRMTAWVLDSQNQGLYISH
jgi:hypothetical protein